ncbi:hypothetical protein [Edaphobacter modestus]|uniref:Uncharacterized protein n=1 Tax=Edaphobacter modestus TaxID=388466 RepID=A0A4Q7XXE7_9BACT|nr:hypothetical protein [Edaphobacter modestus]RZU29042.1 hypothetical protein BDD14_6636 [Edaphobacter modestus]
MIHRKRTATGLLLMFCIASTVSSQTVLGFPLFGKKKSEDYQTTRKLTANQVALVDKAIASEKALVKTVSDRTPLVETYIQLMKPQPVFGQVPSSDQHFLGRVDFEKVIRDDAYQINQKTSKGTVNGKAGFLKQAFFLPAVTSSSLHMNFSEAGFVQMLLIDSANFDRQHYVFSYVRNEFLGSIPTAVFSVTPIHKKRSKGRFFGRIWVESHSGSIVRFNGKFDGSETDHRDYYNFDSWRTNVQPNLWLPTSIYVEATDSRSATRTLRFKAISNVWGYQLIAPSGENEKTSLDVVGATDVSNDGMDLSPLGAQREWVNQAENNIIDRLYQAGLIDAPSEFDKTLEALASNILAYNGITPPRPVRCRTLLTEPLESLAVGDTILISKGLLDTTGVISQDGAQQMGNINGILAFQLAHILLSHRLDTKFAFSDRTLFPSTEVFNRLPMHHTDEDNTAAAKKAMELQSAKELEGGQQYFGLYLKQLQQQVKQLKALNEPLIGDGLVKSDRDPTLWMAALVTKAPNLDANDLKQQSAMPLSSFLRHDPWSGQLTVRHSAYEPLLSPADKMPFDITPVYLKLNYYQEAAQTSASN